MSTGAAAEGGTGWIAVALRFAAARLRDRQVSARPAARSTEGASCDRDTPAGLERGIEQTEQ
jgi:hypothetical protein